MLHLCRLRIGIGWVVFGNEKTIEWKTLTVLKNFLGAFSLWEKDGTYKRKKCKGLVQKVKTRYFECSSTDRTVCVQHSLLSFKIKCAFAFYHIFLWMSFQVRISEDLLNGQWLFALENDVHLWHLWIYTDFTQLSVFQWSYAMVFYAWAFCTAAFE